MVIVAVLSAGSILIGEQVATGRGTSITSWVGPTDYTWVPVLMIFLAVLLAIALFAATMPLFGGRSAGKAATGLRVHRTDGRRAGVGHNLLRDVVVKWLLFYWVLGQCLIPWVLDWLWPLWDDRRQSLHDKVVDTVVVHERGVATVAAAAGPQVHDVFGR